jgi:hypothetical protein
VDLIGLVENPVENPVENLVENPVKIKKTRNQKKIKTFNVTVEQNETQ